MTLADRIEAASGPSYALDCEIGEYVAKATGTPYLVPPKPYTASIDAALTLVPDQVGPWSAWNWAFMSWLKGRTPALAICAAALRGRATGEVG